MPSEVDICNRALAHIGITNRIQDLDNDTTNIARNCRLFFDTCRDSILEMRPWGFAKREVELQTVGTAPTNWNYQYLYPNFAARINKIINPQARTPATVGEQIPFEIRDYDGGTGKVIVTDQYQACAQYNYKVDNPALFSETFAFALSLMLATNIATPLRANAKIAALANQRWSAWLAETSVQEANEQSNDPYPDSEFVSGRY